MSEGVRKTAGPCTGICPQIYLGYDGTANVYYYAGLDCTTRELGDASVLGSDSRAHELGGDCNNCNDCIQSFFKHTSGNTSSRGAMTRPYLRRGFYRKGVANPNNPGHVEDAFYPAKGAFVLAEYTAEYSRQEKAIHRYAVRLALIAFATNPKIIFGLGWELDHASPPSPLIVPHLCDDWIRPGPDEPGGHLIEVTSIAMFHVQIVAPEPR